MVAATLAGLLAVGGCRPAAPPPPTYGTVDDQTALRTLADRAAAVKTVYAESALTLTRADGQSVQLDGVVAMAPPDNLRLQAFKVGQTVFDLTLTPDGLWIKTADDPARRDKIVPASQNAAAFVREWAWFNGGFFTSEGLVVQPGGGSDRMVIRKSLSDGRSIVCDVDRPTLTARRYRMLDPAGVVRFTLTLEDYRLFNGIAWPTRLTAESEQGTIIVETRAPEINGQLPDKAFVPPPRAEKRT